MDLLGCLGFRVESANRGLLSLLVPRVLMFSVGSVVSSHSRVSPMIGDMINWWDYELRLECFRQFWVLVLVVHASSEISWYHRIRRLESMFIVSKIKHRNCRCRLQMHNQC